MKCTGPPGNGACQYFYGRYGKGMLLRYFVLAVEVLPAMRRLSMPLPSHLLLPTSSPKVLPIALSAGLRTPGAFLRPPPAAAAAALLVPAT